MAAVYWILKNTAMDDVYDFYSNFHLSDMCDVYRRFHASGGVKAGDTMHDGVHLPQPSTCCASC